MEWLKKFELKIAIGAFRRVLKRIPVSAAFAALLQGVEWVVKDLTKNDDRDDIIFDILVGIGKIWNCRDGKNLYMILAEISQLIEDVLKNYQQFHYAYGHEAVANISRAKDNFKEGANENQQEKHIKE